MRRRGTRASGGKQAVFFLAAALLFAVYACAGNLVSGPESGTAAVTGPPAETGSTEAGGEKTADSAAGGPETAETETAFPVPALVTRPDGTEVNGPEIQPAETAENDAAEAPFRITFLDIGQGDAALVECGGKRMLIDGGPSAQSAEIYTFLRNRNISRLDVIVATHAHEDHVGGLAAALVRADAEKIYCPVTDDSGKAFRSFEKQLQKRNREITVPVPGERFSLGGAEAEIIAPIDRDWNNVNNSSIVLRLTYGSRSFLFTGDAESEEEASLLASGYDLQADVLKVAHHGSSSSSTWSFLTAVRPRYAVISAGRDNSYHDPSDHTLEQLKRAGAEIFRTDRDGDIICTCDGTDIRFATE